MLAPAYFALTLLVVDVLLLGIIWHRMRKQRREDNATVDAIVSYQRGDLDPWDPRYLYRAKQSKRHGYTFNRKYHEDPWEVGVPK